MDRGRLRFCILRLVLVCASVYVTIFLVTPVEWYNRHRGDRTEPNNLPKPSDTPKSSEPEANYPDGYYISMCSSNFDGRRLGNQLFNFVAMLYVAKLVNKAIEKLTYSSNYSENHNSKAKALNAEPNLRELQRWPTREPIMPTNHPDGWLDRWFNISIKRYTPQPGRLTEGICPPCSLINETKGLAFESLIQSRVQELVRTKSSHKAFLLCGWFQRSWKYTVGIEEEIRQQLRFTEQISNQVDQFLNSNLPCRTAETGCTEPGQFTRVGVHVRRADILSAHFSAYGFSTANEEYLHQAMKYFMNTTRVVQFIFVSDDMSWTRRAVSTNISLGDNAQFLFSDNPPSPAFDLALLSRCDHVIVTTGTFGWWGAWLANGTTIYYSQWPKKNSNLEQSFNREDFFPPSWISMP